MRIAEPLAAIDLDSESILVRTGRQEVATLAGAKWSDRLPLLVQSRLTQTFENANLLRQVGRRPATAADYDLDIDIRAFDLDVARSRVEVDFAVKIVSAGSGRVVAAEIFTAEAPVASTNGADGFGGAGRRAFVGHDADRRVRGEAIVTTRAGTAHARLRRAPLLLG